MCVITYVRHMDVLSQVLMVKSEETMQAPSAQQPSVEDRLGGSHRPSLKSERTNSDDHQSRPLT